MTTLIYPNTFHEALFRFEQADWTFAAEKTNIGVHGIHPYPAKFVPQLPRRLVHLFHPVVGGSVLDPFCGSGTTLVECQSQGIPSFGIDLNPIATLIAKVKTNPPTERIAPIASDLVASASEMASAAVPEIPRLAHWFTRGASTGLAKLRQTLLTVEQTDTRDALRVALSRIIVKVSRQESDTRYAAVDRHVNETDVYSHFLRSASALDKAFATTFDGITHNSGSTGVLTKNILLVQPRDLPCKFGLIVTSPPYPNAYEYWLYHKYRMYWLGEDPVAVRNSEIGSRHRYFTTNPATPLDFFNQMSLCFRLFEQITLPHALVCIVVGRSIIRGEEVDNATHLRDAAASHGFRQCGSATRQIPKRRKSFNPSHGTITTEQILVFSRDRQ